MNGRSSLHPPGTAIVWLALFLSIVLFPARSPAQSPGLFEFPPTPCDSVHLEMLSFSSGATGPVTINRLVWRDGNYFWVDSTLTLPATVGAGETLKIPIWFAPTRRGKTTDSLTLIGTGPTGPDTFRIRIRGTGIGPELDANPIVINFPKTNQPASAQLQMWMRNNGERPYTLTTGALTVPAPFSLVTALPLTIQAGDSVQLTFKFEPTERGIFSQTINIPSGCSRTLQIGLNGSTDLIGTGAVIRASKIRFNPVNDEVVPCGDTICTVVTLSNVGNASLVVDSLRWLHDDLGFLIAPPPELPIVIPANGSRNVTICIDATKRGRVSDTLVIINNNRDPIAFGMVIDISRSMDSNMICESRPVRRIDQAIIEAKAFLANTILYIPSIDLQDQIAISAYSTQTRQDSKPYVEHVFPLSDVTDPVRTAAQTSLNSLTLIGGTPTGYALRDMIDTLQKSDLENRVIVLLTDGEATDNNGNTSAAAVADYASQQGIRIFTIRIRQDASSIDYLNTLSRRTGGASYNADDCKGLQEAFESITDIVSRGAVHMEPFSISVRAAQLAGTREVKFDSTEMGQDTCMDFTLANIGEGTVVIQSMDDLIFTDDEGAPITDFMVDPSTEFPITIQEVEAQTIRLCFKPTKLRNRTATLKILYNSCGDGGYSPSLEGAAYAYANLRASDERIGLPGDMVTMPIHSDTALATYDVKKITYRVEWDATMLDLRGVTPGPVAAGGTIAINGAVAITGTRAAAEILVTSEQPLAGPGVLGNLDFRVLRGDSLGTLVTVTSGIFEDDNPRAKLVNSGIIALDSTCFRNGKPIRYLSPTAKITAGEITPSPAKGGMITLPVTASEPARIDVTLYGLNGDVVVNPRSQVVETGRTEMPIAVDMLPAGDYYAVVRTSTGETILRKLTVVR